MKTKTSELTGDALAWAVAECEGRDCYADKDGIWFRDSSTHPDESETDYGGWTLCGPIIEREKMDSHAPTEVVPYWTFFYSIPRVGGCAQTLHRQKGPTALIAAMRCYVACKLGEEVEVPDELLGE